MLCPLILAAALCSGPWSPKVHWPDVDRRSPALIAKVKRQERARHAAAERSRRDFDEAIRILNSQPIPSSHPCPCTLPGKSAFQ